MKHKVSAVIAAAGSSTRFGSQKLLAPLAGGTVLERTLEVFERCSAIDEIILVTGDSLGELARNMGLNKLVAVVDGGATRAESVRRGAQTASGDILLIHDAARPFVTGEQIEKVVLATEQYGAAALFVEVIDTVKTRDGWFVKGSLERSSLVAAQTPQGFFTADYLRALDNSDGTETDDCEIAAKAGIKVRIVDGSFDNIKITSAKDLRGYASTEHRVGHGYDVHRFCEGRRLILCGVDVPFDKGLLGHSDADVAVHAVIDAMLGAAVLGDIGAMFPDSDERYRGADSIGLLKQAYARVKSAGWSLENADITIVAQRPKLADFIAQMRGNIAAACGTNVDRISVKATTEEGLGFTGGMLGIAAHSVVMLARPPFSSDR